MKSTQENPSRSPGRNGRLVVVTGPSGVGKSTLVRAVIERTGAVFSVSVTTRKPRPGEVEGREYRFVDRATFDRMVANDELLEWAQVYGDCYGTPARDVRAALDEGKTVLLEIDVQGGLQVHRKAPEATFVLVLPPSDEELQRRLTSRGTETPAVVARRLRKARDEIRAARESGAYTMKVVNEDLDAAVDQVVDIIRQESQPQ
jgi:guanylate kinase